MNKGPCQSHSRPAPPCGETPGPRGPGGGTKDRVSLPADLLLHVVKLLVLVGLAEEQRTVSVSQPTCSSMW